MPNPAPKCAAARAATARMLAAFEAVGEAVSQRMVLMSASRSQKAKWLMKYGRCSLARLLARSLLTSALIIPRLFIY